MAEETRNSLEDLSDKDLFARLKAGQGDESWTVAELMEVERRGYEFLAEDPELQTALQTTISELLKNIVTAVNPAVIKISEAAKAATALSESMKRIALPSTQTQLAMDALTRNSKAIDDIARVTYQFCEPEWLTVMQKSVKDYGLLGKSLQATALAVAGLDLRGVTGPAGPAPLNLVARDPKTIKAVATPLEMKIDADVQNDFLKAMIDTANNTRATSERLKFNWKDWVTLAGVSIAAIGTIILVLRNH